MGLAFEPVSEWRPQIPETKGHDHHDRDRHSHIRQPTEAPGGDRNRPRVPHVMHLRELEMPDGRKLLLDWRSIAFLAEAKPEEFGGRKVTIVAFKTLAKACPVTAGYQDLKAWWRRRQRQAV